MSSKRKKRTEPSVTTNRVRTGIPSDEGRLAIPFVLILLVRIAGYFLPSERAWGFNHAAFLPLWLDGGLMLIGSMLCTPRLYSGFLWGAQFLHGEKSVRERRTTVVTLVVMAAAVFWFFRLQTYFLGDGAVYLSEQYRFVRGIPGSEDVLYSKGSAPLTGWVLANTAKLAYGISSDSESILASPQFSFWFIGMLAGCVFVAFAWTAAKHLVARQEGMFSFLMLLLTSAGVLFYFGYVEYYTLYFTAMAVHFYASYRALRGEISLWYPVAALIAATAFHFMAVVALPGFLLVVLSRSRFRALQSLVRARIVFIAIGAILAISGVFYFTSGIAENGSRVVLSLSPFGREGAVQSYTLLSSYHLLDTLNYLFLLSAPQLVLCAFLFRREHVQRHDVLVAMVHVVFFFFLAFFGNLGFGMARDWDINAALGLAIVFLAMQLYRLREDEIRASYLLYLTVGSSLIGGVSWFAVNIRPDASVERYRSILALEDRHLAGDYALNGYEHLRKYYFSHRDYPNVAWSIRKKIECVGYPLDFQKLAMTAVQHLNGEERNAAFIWLFDRLDEKFQTMNKDGTDRVYAGSRETFRDVAAEAMLLAAGAGMEKVALEPQRRRLETLFPRDPVFALVDAQNDWTATGAIADVTPFVEGARSVRTSSMLSFIAGRALVHERRYQEARSVLERSVALDSSFTLPLLYLAVAETEISATNAALAQAHILRFLEESDGWRLTGDPQEANRLRAYAQTLLERLGTMRNIAP